jgi:hypothetical protein
MLTASGFSGVNRVSNICGIDLFSLIAARGFPRQVQCAAPAASVMPTSFASFSGSSRSAADAPS